MEGFRVQEFESSGFRDGTVQCSGHWGILGLPAAGVQGIGFFNFRRFGTWNNSIVIFQWLAPENHHYDNLYYSPFRTPPPYLPSGLYSECLASSGLGLGVQGLGYLGF